MKTARILLTALLALTTTLHAQTSNLGEGDSYAYGANLGWIELTPHRPAAGNGVRVSDTILSGYAWSANTGWINFGDGTPDNLIQYSNTDGTDFGVTHDGAGNLGGLAWSANLGWINFGWAGSGNPNRPRINLLHGAFTGYAWSSNAGWINLDTGYLKTDSIAITDTDGDGLSDTWERSKVSKIILFTATGDNDGDGITNYQEPVP
jgi:YD repeat-containing protein